MKIVAGGGRLLQPTTREGTNSRQKCYNQQTEKLQRTASWDGHCAELRWSPWHLGPCLRQAAEVTTLSWNGGCDLLHPSLGAFSLEPCLPRFAESALTSRRASTPVSPLVRGGGSAGARSRPTSAVASTGSGELKEIALLQGRRRNGHGCLVMR